MNTSGLGRTLHDERTNAVVAWVLLGCVAGIALITIDADPLWSGFAVCVVILGVVPAVITRSLRAMLPWEVLVLASLPLLLRTVTPHVGQVATYFAVAAIALIVAVELHVFTRVRMNYSFAVLFVVTTTLAAAGVWAIVRWSADIYLGIAFTLTDRELMIEFVASTVAGVLAGITFELYFRRFTCISERLEGDV